MMTAADAAVWLMVMSLIMTVVLLAAVFIDWD